MDYNALLDMATDLGYELAMAGAETFRVEESINRCLAAYGIQAEVFAIPNYLAVSIITEDGQPITLLPDGMRIETPVPVESVMVDGKGVGDVGRVILKERRILGGEGLVAVVLVLAEETGEVLHGPEMISRGFVFEQQYNHLLEDSKCIVLDQIENTNPSDTQKLCERIRSSLRRFFRDVLGRDPVVVPIVSKV